MKRFLITAILLILFVFQVNSLAFAEEKKIEINWVYGPQVVNVGSDLAKLDLPEGYVFANGEDAKKIMEQFGNPPSNQEVGIVFPRNENEDWFILFEYDPLGFVKDDEGKDLDADKILESIKKGTEAANKEREDKGMPSLEILGWDEKPHYDSSSHNLVWSVIAQSDGDKVVNYNTRILGRFGITSITLVSDPSKLVAIKPELNKIINNYTYKSGKKYSDYVPGKDKVSELGLTALIAGGAGAAAAKLGLFAKILLVFKKIWIILFAGVAGFYRKIKGKIFGKNAESPKGTEEIISSESGEVSDERNE